ncbi:MAG TPA: hypothetical protein VGB90_10475 [Alphaproteobacteria bacterium]
MKGLPGLIRLARWKLDEQRRTLAGLESLADEFRRQIGQLDAEVRREADVARTSPEAARTYSAFAASSLARRQRLEKSLHDTLRQAAAQHEEVTRAFQELRRYEIAQDQRERQAAKIARRHDQIAQNEVGLNVFRRRTA